MNPFSTNGLWWIPGKRKKLNGNLMYDPDTGGKLELQGLFQSYKDSLNKAGKGEGDWHSPDIILGYGNNGKKYTLYLCFQREMHGPVFSAPLTTSIYHVYYIIEGHHFVRGDWIAFDEIIVRFNHLEMWLNITEVKITDKIDGTLIITSRKLNPITIKLKTYEIQIYLNSFLSLKHDITCNKYHINELAYIKIKPDKPQKLESYSNGILYLLKTFFSLGFGRNVLINEFIGRNNKCR
jgi:hypothetical protein